MRYILKQSAYNGLPIHPRSLSSATIDRAYTQLPVSDAVISVLPRVRYIVSFLH